MLVVDWISNGRSPVILGLDMPLSTMGMLGLGIAAFILIGVGVTMPAALKQKGDSGAVADNPLPTTLTELRVFIILSFILGVSWELLYRGYLLWALTPHIGLIASILVAAAAYGVAHGYKDSRSFAGSLISALIFTTAFAITNSLWWLMVVHCGLPLIGALANYSRLRSLAAR